MKTKGMHQLIRQFKRYHSHGTLPREGGSDNQDAKLMLSFDVLESYWQDNQKM